MRYHSSDGLTADWLALEDTIELMRQLKVDSALIVGFRAVGIMGLDIAIHPLGAPD